MTQTRGKAKSMASVPILPPTAEKNSRGRPSNKTPREINSSLGEVTEGEREKSVSTKRAKKAKNQKLTVKVSYNGRKITNEDGNSVTYYESTNTGMNSASAHAKPVNHTFATEQLKDIKLSDIVQVIQQGLNSLTPSVVYDENIHLLASPVLMPDQSQTATLDHDSSRPQSYHLLEVLTPENFNLTSNCLSICVLPKNMTADEPHQEKPRHALTPSAVPPKEVVKVRICHGGVKYQKVYMSDRRRTAKPKTITLTSVDISYPITKEKLLAAANTAMMKHGGLMCCFDPEVHVLLREQLIEKPSGPKEKRGSVPRLPECVKVPESFWIQSEFIDELVMVVFEKDMSEVSSCEIGGSNAQNSEADAKVAQKMVVNSIMINFRKRQKYLPIRGLSLQGDITNQGQYETSAKTLVKWAYDKIDKEQDQSVKGIERSIVNYLTDLPRTQETTSKLPMEILVEAFPHRNPTFG